MTDKEYKELCELRCRVEELMSEDKIENTKKTDESGQRRLRLLVVYDRINGMIRKHETGRK